MATVKVIGSSQQMNGQVEIKIEVRTSAGRFEFPIRFVDQGSLAANESQARRELETLLRESLDALQHP
jgi:hypothetical protein